MDQASLAPTLLLAMPQLRDPNFARHQIGLEHAFAALDLQRAFERAQRGNATSRHDLQGDMGFPNAQRERAQLRIAQRRLEGNDAEGKADRVKFGCAQHVIQSNQVRSRNAHEQRLLFAGAQVAQRTDDMQRGHVGVEAGVARGRSENAPGSIG